MPNWESFVPRFCESVLAPTDPEYWNAFSSLAIVLCGSLGAFYTSRLYPHPSIRQLFMLMVINGVGSFGYHWTGQYGWSKVDAWTMLIFSMISIPLTFESIFFQLTKPVDTDKWESSPRRHSLEAAPEQEAAPVEPVLARKHSLMKKDNSVSSELATQFLEDLDTEVSQSMPALSRGTTAVNKPRPGPALGAIGRTESLTIKVPQDCPPGDSADKTPVSSSTDPHPSPFRVSQRAQSLPSGISQNEKPGHEQEGSNDSTITNGYVRSGYLKSAQLESPLQLPVAVHYTQSVLSLVVTSSNFMAIILDAVQIPLLDWFTVGTLSIALFLVLFTVLWSHRVFLAGHDSGALVKQYIFFLFGLVLASGVCWIVGEAGLCGTAPKVLSKIPLHALWH
ncbi:hypothetical protein HDU91_001173, partial [Kappamyces sp. JEL0680]